MTDTMHAYLGDPANRDAWAEQTLVIPTETDAVITLEGRPFRVAEKFGLMPLIRFGYLSKKGISDADEEGLAAMYGVIMSAIHPDDWEAFQDWATDCRADGDQLMAVVGQAIEVISQRPTLRPSDSSDGPPATETSSSAGSSSPESLTPRELQRREQMRHLTSVDSIARGTA